MRSRTSHSEDDTRTTRDVILDVAERHFSERGFAGASVRDIAADAGLRNQASLYHHFEHKRALYEAVLTRGLAPVFESVAASSQYGIAPTDAGALPVRFLDPVIDYLVAHPHLPRLIQRATLDDSPYLRSVVSRIFRPLYESGVAVIAQSGNDWQPADYFHVGAALYQLIFGYFANATLFEIVTEQDPLGPEVIARQREFLRRAVALLLSAQTGAPRGGQRP